MSVLSAFLELKKPIIVRALSSASVLIDFSVQVVDEKRGEKVGRRLGTVLDFQIARLVISPGALSFDFRGARRRLFFACASLIDSLEP
jgi:hypothetical protein